MKKLIILFFIVSLNILFSCGNGLQKQTEFKNGDIVFQTSETDQSEAIKIATNSKFSHCGIIFIENNKTFVYEAVQPVSKTSLEAWIKNGKDKKYAVKRYKNVLSKEIQSKMYEYGKTHLNKDYDINFDWNDKTMYCSELVWKIFKNGAKIELCKTKKLKEFNLKNPIVKEIMKKRYGTKIPYHEKVVAPSQLFDSELLETVFNNY